MRARVFSKRIEIWQTSSLSDGFGGNTVDDILISRSWAKIETAKSNANNLNDIGLDDMSLNLLITVRYRHDLPYNGINQFIKYRGERYEFSQAPDEMDLNETFVKLIATREKKNEVPKLMPIFGYPYTYSFALS